MNYIGLILKLIYFMLPAHFANMSPVFGKFIFSKFILTPIDFGLEAGGRPLFGRHKTIGGFLFGIIVALIIGYFQYILYPRLKDFCFIDYGRFWVDVSFLLGFGAMTGDLIKSFFKRRLNIKAGAPWVPFDEIDFVIGALVFVSPVYFLGWANIFLSLIIGIFGHALVNWLGFLLRIRKKKEIIDLPAFLIKTYKKW